ncbi:MAG: hypothetical protein ABI481_01760 [Pyrinomonadaceae bacterium]
MRPLNLLARFLIVATLFTTIFLSQSVQVTGQVVVDTNPSPVTRFPLTMELPSGTYYFSVYANAGPATISLEFDPPDGGGGMSVSISGPDCCGGDAYVGTDTGLSNPVRRESTFNVPSRQRLVLAVYISVRPQARIPFTINMSGSIRGGTEGTDARGSGIIITDPPSEPVGPPSRVCTDLGLIDGVTVDAARDLRSITISGVLRNLSPRPYIANPHMAARRTGWIEIVAFENHREPPRIVRQIPFTYVEANGSRPFRVTHTITTRPPVQYQVSILYSPANFIDRTTTNDDCNGANNVVRSRFLISEPDTIMLLEPLPKKKS